MKTQYINPKLRSHFQKYQTLQIMHQKNQLNDAQKSELFMLSNILIHGLIKDISDMKKKAIVTEINATPPQKIKA